MLSNSPNPRRATVTTWDTKLYLTFEEERNQPCRDLLARIRISAPARIVDLGCGPGNSTAILRARWEDADLTGVDSAPEMLASARQTASDVHWTLGDLRSWTPAGAYDLVFSNAALQWVPEHAGLIPRLWSWVAPGGALAFQVPVRTTPPAAWVRALERARARSGGDTAPLENVERSEVLSPAEYFELLAPTAARVDLWDTEYDHVLPGPDAIVEWTRGTALREYLARLADDATRTRFLSAYREEIRREYPLRHGGRVVFPFDRRFVLAYR